jgi:hypothetical protein
VIGRLLSWIHHSPQPAWRDPYRAAATVEEEPAAQEEEEDIDAPPAVAVVRGRPVGPDSIPSLPPLHFWLCLSAGLFAMVMILVVAISQRDCRKVVMNDSNGDPAVTQICR